MGAFSKGAGCNFLEVPAAFALSPLRVCTWGPLGSCKGLVLHIWSCAVPHQQRNKFTASVRINIYQNSSVTAQQENNNNNNNKETSQETKEWLIPLPGLIYFYSSNNKEFGNELHLLSSVQ